MVLPTARSRPFKPAGLPAAVSRPNTSTRRSTTSRSRKLGSMMGSGGMIVMDQDTDMVDVARFFMEFCMEESCGKCIPCRAGTVQLHGLLEPHRQRARHQKRLACARVPLRHGQTHQPLRPRSGGTESGARAPCVTFVTNTRESSRGRSHVGEDVYLERHGHEAPATIRRSFRPRARLGRSYRRCATWKGMSDVGACRLCLVEVLGTGRLVALMRHPRRRRHVDPDRNAEAAGISPHDRRVVARRAKSCLLGVRGQQPLRAPGPGNRSWESTTSGLTTSTRTVRST